MSKLFQIIIVLADIILSIPVTKTRPVFQFEQVRETVLGFLCPQYVNDINIPGYHLHFISDDRTKGGHFFA